MNGLDNKLAIVTGAASGIGQATAVKLAAAGARLLLTDRDTRGLEATQQQIGADRADIFAADLTDSAQVQAIIDRAADRADVLCNVAGVLDNLRPVASTSDTDWELVHNVNVRAPFQLIRGVLPGMIEQGSGAIVNVASAAGITGGRGGAAYTASKHALVGLTRSTAFSSRQQGIRCNAVCPGGISTPMGTPSDPDPLGLETIMPLAGMMGRFGQPGEVAALITWLCSDQASYVNGAVIPVDNAWTAG